MHLIRRPRDNVGDEELVNGEVENNPQVSVRIIFRTTGIPKSPIAPSVSLSKSASFTR